MLLLVGLGALLGAILLLAGLGPARGTTGVSRSLALIHGIDGAPVPVSEEQESRLLAAIAGQARRLAKRLSTKGSHERLLRLLDRAGNPPSWPIERIYAAKGISLIGGATFAIMTAGLDLKGILLAIVAGMALLHLPDLLLYNTATKRADETTKGLGEALDMLCVCVQAGQGFDAALMQVARNLHGPIAGEFARILSEIQIGKSRQEAFAAMGQRLRTPEVRNFITALVQADRMGIPLAGVLHEQTIAMRTARRQKAEAKAQQVTVKILFPLLLCIFPVVFVVVIGPGALGMMDAFSR